MKPSIIFLMFIVILPSFVFAAGEMKTIDFNNSSTLLVQIDSNNGVRFDWGDKNHKVVVGNMNRASQRVELTTFIDGAPTPYYAYLTSKTNVVLDFNQDDAKDMKVSLVKFVANDTVILLFEKINEPKPSPKAELVGKNWFNRVFSRGPFKNPFYNLGLLVVVVVVIVVFLASSRLVRRKYRRIRRSMLIG